MSTVEALSGCVATHTTRRLLSVIRLYNRTQPLVSVRFCAPHRRGLLACLAGVQRRLNQFPDRAAACFVWLAVERAQAAGGSDKPLIRFRGDRPPAVVHAGTTPVERPVISAAPSPITTAAAVAVKTVLSSPSPRSSGERGSRPSSIDAEQAREVSIRETRVTLPTDNVPTVVSPLVEAWTAS